LQIYKLFLFYQKLLNISGKLHNNKRDNDSNYNFVIKKISLNSRLNLKIVFVLHLPVSILTTLYL
jgi:hypothetical protein